MTASKHRIRIVGAGDAGLVTGAGLASAGPIVVGVGIDPFRLASIERGLAALVRHQRDAGQRWDSTI